MKFVIYKIRGPQPRKNSRKFMLRSIKKTLAEKKAPLLTKERSTFLNRKIPKKVLVNGFTKLPNVIIFDNALSCQDIRVLMILDFHSKNKNECWPSHQTISKESSCHLRGVQRSLKNLKKFHYIDWTRTKFTNKYFLIYKVQMSKVR